MMLSRLTSSSFLRSSRTSTRSWKKYLPTSSHLTTDDSDPRNNGRLVVLRCCLSSSTTSRSSSSLALEETNVDKSHKEAWMVNLRGVDEEWLTGMRSEDWFTGVPPKHCPGVDENGILRSLPLPNLSCVTKSSTQEYFDNSWTLHETLFAGLKGEEPFYRPPVHGLRHPQIFYYGHTPCLYINKLRVSNLIPSPVNSYFESIFEVGVDEMLWDDMHKNDMIWPNVSEVQEYRKQVYQAVTNVIDECLSENETIVTQKDPLWSLFMGFEHERIHMETSSVLFREMPDHLVQKPSHHWPSIHPSSSRKTPTCDPIQEEHYPTNPLLPAIPKSKIDLGKPRDFPSFGWDNEYGSRTVSVPQFQASKYMVTNGEFYEFVKDGGYRTKEYWCEMGWGWRKHRNMKWPFFWEKAGPEGSHEYNLRTIFEMIPMQWDWPVDVNYYEAKAFCRWKTRKDKSAHPYRLPTEAEHQTLRDPSHNLSSSRNSPTSDKVLTESGHDFPNGPTASNLNLAYSSQSPVTSFPPTSHTGHHDVAGNAWEWTEDDFNPLEGFSIHPYYDDFSTPCFDGKHSMIAGGSFMSTGDEASVFARFHFRPHFLQHSGFRLVLSEEEAPAMKLEEKDGDVYDTRELLDMYLGMHFPSSGEREGVEAILNHDGKPSHGLRFPQRVAKLLGDLKPNKVNGRVLDIGCSVGGTAFELAKHFDQVEAFDFSKSFIDAATQMKNLQPIHFHIPIEASISKRVKATHETGCDDPQNLQKIHFFTADACRLSEYYHNHDLGTFDGVIMSNLLCRLPDPIKCLDALPYVVNRGGVVVIVTPFSWLEEFTPKNKWMGGYVDLETGREVYSKDELKMIMEKRGFEKIHEEEIPVVIREHQRKYQYIVSQATGWRKK